MFKKLASLLLSMLLCLSLLPGQAFAADAPTPADPPVITEPVDPETPEDPEEPIMPMAAEDEWPEEIDAPHHL